MKKLFIDIPAIIESGGSAENIQCEYFHFLKLQSFQLTAVNAKKHFVLMLVPKRPSNISKAD
jgi:hypothetical protein